MNSSKMNNPAYKAKLVDSKAIGTLEMANQQKKINELVEKGIYPDAAKIFLNLGNDTKNNLNQVYDWRVSRKKDEDSDLLSVNLEDIITNFRRETQLNTENLLSPEETVVIGNIYDNWRRNRKIDTSTSPELGTGEGLSIKQLYQNLNE